MKLSLLAFLLLALCVIGCRSTQPSYSSTPSDSGKITTEKAQNAIDRFASGNGTGSIRIIGGVQEIPAQNAGAAQLDVNNWTDNKGRNFNGKQAVATFTHYTDGRWVLTKIEISLGEWNGSTWWTMQIPV